MTKSQRKEYSSDLEHEEGYTEFAFRTYTQLVNRKKGERKRKSSQHEDIEYTDDGETRVLRRCKSKQWGPKDHQS